MPLIYGKLFKALPLAALLIAAVVAHAAQSGNAGSVRGTVTDQSGAVIPDATVHLKNAISGLDRSVKTDGAGQFEIDNVPFNNYNLSASASGFASQSQNFTLRSAVGMNLQLVLQIEATASTVTVEASGDLVETDPTFHTDVDRDMFIKVPLESSIIFAELSGDAGHSGSLGRLQRAVSWHGRPRIEFVFGRRPIHHRPAEQSLLQPDSARTRCSRIQVIAGAPPAEYGDKTSLVIVATTRSGQGVDQAHRKRHQPRTERSAPRTADSIFPTAERTGATLLRSMV